MAIPHLHFSREELENRRKKACQALVDQRLDGILLFSIEDMYWLTGLDSDGFHVFNCMFLGSEGQLTYVARRVDYANVRYSSIINDFREWPDSLDSGPANSIKDMLATHGMEGKRIGIQLDSLGLKAKLFLELSQLLNGWCELSDASYLIGELRLVKSEQELAYIRKAGEICDKLRDVAIERTYTGAFEGDIFGRIMMTIFENDGDPPSLRAPMGAGEAATNSRYTTSRHYVQENDQVFYEIGCAYRHYHAAQLFIVFTGPDVDDRLPKMLDVCVEALYNVQKVIRPGRTLGEVFDAQRVIFTKYGHDSSVMTSCGYFMGATFPPSWVDQKMIVRNSPIILKENMSLFTYMSLKLKDGTRMGVGEQYIVTDDEPEVVTHAPRKMIIKP